MKAKPAPAGDMPLDGALLGSSLLPAMIDVGSEAEVQLGTIVQRAHEESGLTWQEWNALDEADREARLAGVVTALRAANGHVAPTVTDPLDHDGDGRKGGAKRDTEGGPAPEVTSVGGLPASGIVEDPSAQSEPKMIRLTVAPSDEFGPAGRFVDLTAAELAAAPADVLVEPTPEQLALRVS